MTNHRNIDEVKASRGFFTYGVKYSDLPITEKIKYSKPDRTALKGNHGAYGQPVPDEKNRKAVNEMVNDQIKREKQEQRRAKFISLLDKFKISNILPTKLMTIFNNMPTFTTKNIYKYFRAELSNIEQGPVSLPVYEERKKICGECPKRMFPEGYSDPLGFCTECGCGANPRAQLTVKLKLPATSCPLGKWDEAPGIYEGLWGRIRYIFTRRRSK